MTQRGGCAVVTRPASIPLNAKGPHANETAREGLARQHKRDGCSMPSEYKGDIAALWEFSNRPDNGVKHELLG